MFLAASRDKLIVPEWTVKGNLWTAELEALSRTAQAGPGRR
jgi:hypothetical protein